MLSHESIDAANEDRTIIGPIGRLLRIVQQVKWALQCVDAFQVVDGDLLERNLLLRMRMVCWEALGRLRGGYFAVRISKQRFRSPDEIVVCRKIASCVQFVVVLLQLQLVKDGILMDPVLDVMNYAVQVRITHDLELVDIDKLRSIGDLDIVREDCRCLLLIFDG